MPKVLCNFTDHKVTHILLYSLHINLWNQNILILFQKQNGDVDNGVSYVGIIYVGKRNLLDQFFSFICCTVSSTAPNVQPSS
jgi:hypothetical protein